MLRIIRMCRITIVYRSFRLWEGREGGREGGREEGRKEGRKERSDLRVGEMQCNVGRYGVIIIQYCS